MSEIVCVKSLRQLHDQAMVSIVAAAEEKKSFASFLPKKGLFFIIG